MKPTVTHAGTIFVQNVRMLKYLKKNMLFVNQTTSQSSEYQWEKAPSGNGKEYLEKCLKQGRLVDLFNDACKLLPSFLTHYFTKQKQADAYESHKKALQTNTKMAVLQMDFAENFSTLWQDEVQSAHWNKKQITVFTSVLWQQDSCTSAVTVSDDLTHSRDSVIVFLDNLLNHFLDSCDTLQIWSDGPSSQFKNCYIAAVLPWLENKHHIKIYWNFFATSHGKGPVDGVGGTIKRLATQKVLQRKVNITDAMSFYEAIKNESLIEVLYLTSDEIREKIDSTELGSIIANAPSKPGIFSAHQLEVIDKEVKIRPYSAAEYFVNQISTNPTAKDGLDDNQNQELPESIVKTGSFVIVNYEYASASSDNKSIIKRLVVLVTNKNKDGTIELQYTAPISKRQFKVIENDRGSVNEKDIIQHLLCPTFKHGIYEFDSDLDIDIF